LSQIGDDFAALMGLAPSPETRNGAPVAAGSAVEKEAGQLRLDLYANGNTASSCADDFDALLGCDSGTLTLDSLSPFPQWVAWREVLKDGKPRKVPFNPASPRNGAKANDRSTWGTRTAALKAVAQMPADEGKRGVGLQLGLFDDDAPLRIGGIDLDSCLDAGTGDLEPWAAEVISRFSSYSEVSPSGAGVKVFFTYSSADAAALTDAMRNPDTGKERFRLAWSRGTHCEIGLDVSHRYYAVTGNRWADCPESLRTVPLADLLWLIRDAGPAFLVDATESEAAQKARDESGSGHGYRFLVEQAGLERDEVTAIKALKADTGPAGEWARRTDKRQIARAWKNAKASADARRPITSADEFDDLDELPEVKARDAITARLNRRHAVVVVRGRTLITTERKDGSVDFGTVRDIHAYYENDRVPAGDGKTEPASRRWMRDPQRRSFPDGVTFAPGGCEPGTLNLWRGWAVEPNPDASCEMFLRHVLQVVCRGNAEHAGYVIGWLAQMVQHPDEKPGVGLVLKGAKGAGKDTVADYVSRMIGRRHAPTVAESDHIVGKFNARLENALLLHVQEGSWAGDRKAEGVLKYLVTSDHIEIERKGIDSINLPSVVRLFISANADWVVPASPDERRWAVFEVSERYRGDAAYFAALRAEMNGKGPAALLHYLREYDLSSFNVRAAPETEGLLNQKIESLRGMERWWFEILNRGALGNGSLDDEGDDWADASQVIGRDALRGRYVEWMKGRRFDGETVDERQFGRRLRELVPGLEDKRLGSRTNRIWQYALPQLPDCRAAFEAWIGGPVEWEDGQ
jgi:Family of unknown function (DUF5906)